MVCQKKTRVLVVGAGMAGASAAMYCSISLQKKDLGVANVTLIDGAPYPANDVASSAGDSRMYRKMYSDPFYAKMQEFALEKNWKELEAMCGEQLLVANGLLFYGEETGETVEGSVLGAKKTMAELGIPFESFSSGKDIDARWAGVRAGDKPRYEGVFEHTAGHARAAPTCNAMVRVARAHGCEVRYQDGLKHLRKVGEGRVGGAGLGGGVGVGGADRAGECVCCAKGHLVLGWVDEGVFQSGARVGCEFGYLEGSLYAL